MAVFASKIDPASAAFKRNREDMLALVDKLRRLLARAGEISAQRLPRFQERSQILPRERLSRLLDPGMPFLELYALANYRVDTDDEAESVPGASLISGIGFIRGVRSMVVVSDSGINAGATVQMSGDKLRACQRIALEKKLPYIHLVESAGANLMKYNVENWARNGAVFGNLAKLSAAGIPTLAVLHGPSTAGGAYFPGMSDYVVAVKGRGRASLGGAALVKAATGEDADEEDLAGARMHATISGLVEYLAEDDLDGVRILSDIVARLDWNKGCPRDAGADFRPTRLDGEELAGVVPVDYRTPYDVREVVARIVDGSEFDEFKPGYGATMVCLHAAIQGHACGIVGNNGPIDPDGAAKAGQFYQLCDQADIPIVALNNITGYMVGTAYEQRGMIKHGSKMIQAAATVRVPKITLYIGASFGAGNYGLIGYGFDPDFLFAWPNARTGVMGGEQAASTMEQVARAAAQRRSRPPDEEAFAETRRKLVAHFDRQADAFYTSGRMLDQGVIDPRDTRKVLGFALDTCWEARHRTVAPNTFGIARM